MIGEDKATALAENVTQTSLSTASTRRLAQNWQEVENKKNKETPPHNQPPKQQSKSGVSLLTADIVVMIRIHSTCIAIKDSR